MCFIRSLHPLILWKASADRPRTAAKLRITRLLGRCDTDELLALEDDLKEMVSGRESHGASRPDAPNPTGSKDPQKECRILRWLNDLSNTFPCEKFDQAFCRPKSTTENLLLIVNVRFLKNNAIPFFDKIDDVRRFFFWNISLEYLAISSRICSKKRPLNPDDLDGTEPWKFDGQRSVKAKCLPCTWACDKYGVSPESASQPGPDRDFIIGKRQDFPPSKSAQYQPSMCFLF